MTRFKAVLLVAMAGCTPLESVPASRGETTSALSEGVLRYRGGPVIENARVVVVNWGEGVYAPVHETIPGMYASVLDSPYIDWLAQYNTDTQTIGRGSLADVVTITPDHAAATVTDRDIFDELVAQVGHGLPDADNNTIYAVYLPASVSVNFVGVGYSCVKFCAYHNAFRVDSPTDVIAKFMVVPDQSCDLCLDGRSQVDATEVASTHELIEAITDPVPMAQPAWKADDAHRPEIADLCEIPQGDNFFAPSGIVNGYTVADGWSNAQQACVHAPRTRHDFASDVLMYDSNGLAGLWLMNGPVIVDGALIGSTNGAQIVATGDLDGDDVTDILMRDSSGGLGAWLMNGSSISRGGFIGALVTPPASYTVAGVGDFNADGKSDILLRETGGDIGMWLMDGTHIASGGFVASPGPSYSVAAVADFNGDGKSDVLLVDAAGNLGMWLMNGASIAGGGAPGTPGGTFRVVGTGDFDGDHKADILLRNAAGDIRMWLMDGPTIVGDLFVGSAPAYAVAAVRDFNRDGKADILVRHVTTGDVGMWIMNGANIASGAYVSALDPSYTIISN